MAAGKELLRSWLERIPAPRAVLGERTAVAEVELSQPLRPLLDVESQRAWILVRLHGIPLGDIQLPFRSGVITVDSLEAEVHERLRHRVLEHLRKDGLVSPLDAPEEGSAHHCALRASVPHPAPMVSVVIATRDRAVQLERCLDSILELAYEPLEVLVVDNAPSDMNTRDLVEGRYAGDGRVRYLQEPRAGASRARNLGVKLAAGEIVAFTDDDATVDVGWLEGLVAGFYSWPRVAAVSGLTLPDALDTPAQQAFEAYGSMALGYEPRLYDLAEHRGDTILYPYTAGVFGASNNLAVRRDRFVEIGGFDVTIGPGTAALGAEDLDLFLSLILSGQQIAYQPAAMVRHEHRAEFGALYWQVFTYSAGLTGLLTKWALSDPEIARDLLRRVPAVLPAALFHGQRPSSLPGEAWSYPSRIRWLERVGYLYGPLAYARSRLSAGGVMATRRRLPQRL